MSPPAPPTVGDRLVEAIIANGCDRVFGVPGDFTIKLNSRLDQHPGMFVGTCDEQGAGFAADAYARLRGVAAVLVTWGVGSLKVVNSTAQAWAESVPVVVIAGSPGLAEREGNPLLHHKVKGFDTGVRVMEEVTAMAVELNDPDTAPRLIAEAFATARRENHPVYLELPRDVEAMPAPPLPDVTHMLEPPAPDPGVLADCLADVVALLDSAERPVVVSGVLIARLGLQADLDALARITGLPVAESLLGKSSVGSDYDWFKGVYAGAISSSPEVRQLVEGSDRVMMLGAYLSDLNTGMFTAAVDRNAAIIAHRGVTHVGTRDYRGVGVAHLMRALVRHYGATHPAPPPTPKPRAGFAPIAGEPLRAAALFRALHAHAGPGHTVICDPGDSLFGSVGLQVEESGFIATAYYASLGFAVPAALGAGLARPDRRPFVVVGDGAFQMTALELAQGSRVGVHPIVVVINNGGYGTERPMMDGAFNDIPGMRYHLFPEALGSGVGVRVDTEDGLQSALRDALADTSQLRLVEAVIPPNDISPNLASLTAELRKRVDRSQ